jgi:hypothetical protein
MTKGQEDVKRNLNNVDPQVNRGFELMLRKYNRRDNKPNSKTFQFGFGKMLSLLKREIHFNIEFSLDIKKK